MRSVIARSAATWQSICPGLRLLRFARNDNDFRHFTLLKVLVAKTKKEKAKKMKSIIDVEVKTRTVDFAKCDTDLLAVGLFSDVKELDKLNAELNRKLDGAIERLIALGDFKGKEGTNAIIYANGKIGAKRVILVGLG